jgi:DNA-binding NarL/FixJ family response regulator
MSVRTLIADSAELSLVGLRALLGGFDRVEVVGEARNKGDLQRQLLDLRPQVVLIDHTAEGFGAESIREGIRLSRRTRFVAIVADPSSVAIVNALRAGVSSYIRKDCDLDEIRDAVLRTSEGERFFCGKVLETVQRNALNVEGLAEAEYSCAPFTLSERECQVVRLIAEGRSYTRIAEQLNLSGHTVNTHRRNIMQKLGVNSTAAMVMYAVKHGLVSPNKFLFNS